MNRYLALLLGAVAIGGLISTFARAPRHAATTVAVPGAEATAVELEVRGGAVTPASLAVPKDHRVMLTVVNRGDRPARLALAGYQDRFSIALAPGATWRGAFLADRPGEDFAWLLDGTPVGRVAVTGSHLVEGHR